MKKVLIVDDSLPARSYIGYCLKRLGFKIIYAGDGLEALMKLKEVKPDMVFLDINLPKMNGYVLCRKIKTDEKTKDIPVILVSVRNTDWDKTWGREAGANGYVTKPFTDEEITETVKTFFPLEEETFTPLKKEY